MSARVAANAEMPFESNQKERQSSASDCWSSLFLRGKWPTERIGCKVHSRRRSRRPAGSTPSAKSNPSTLLPPLLSGIWLGSSSTTAIVSSKSDSSDGHASSKYPNPSVCITAAETFRLYRGRGRENDRARETNGEVEFPSYRRGWKGRPRT